MDLYLSQKQHIRKILAMGKRFYDKTPASYRWILSPLKSIHTLSNVFRPKVWIVTGIEILSRQKLTIVFAGHEVNKNYLIQLAFNSSCRDFYVGRKWLWEIRGIAEEKGNDCSLLIAEVPNSFRILSRKVKSFFVPSWLSGEIDISRDVSSLVKNESLRSDIRKTKKNELSFEVSNDLSKLRSFYYNMYLPYVYKVHGNRSVIPSYDYVQSKFRRRSSSNTLLLLKKEEEYIAGTVLLCEKNRSTCWFIGIKDGNLDYVRDGAPGALYYFSICYSANRGLNKFNFGGSRPFLKDGILRYKKKWDQKISNRQEMGFLLKILSESDGVKGFLMNNPFIYEDNTGLNGAIFFEGNESLSETVFEKIYKNYYINGLSRLVIYRFDESENETADIVPPEYSCKMSVCSSWEVFNDKGRISSQMSTL